MKSRDDLYSLADATRLLGANRNLVTYLVRDRQIPTRLVGRSKVLDSRGLDLLRRALAEYGRKPEPVAASASAVASA